MARFGPNAFPDPEGGFRPRKAPVIPRVRVTPGGAALPLETRIRSLLAGRAGAGDAEVYLCGPAGSGKTTALEHLAFVLGSVPALSFRPASFNKHQGLVLRTAWRDTLCVYECHQRSPSSAFTCFDMAPWTEDDLIEYLLATRRDRCASVMKRVAAAAPASRASLGGSPELWRVVLDILADDESVPDVTAALRRALARHLSDPQLRAAEECLRWLSHDRPSGTVLDGLPPDFPAGDHRLLRHRPVQLLLAAERLVAGLCDGDAGARLASPLPRDLVAQAAGFARHWPEAMANLAAMMDADPSPNQAMAASLLLAADPAWRPPAGRSPHLAGAYLAAVQWRDIDLSWVCASAVDLEGADLTGSLLKGGIFQKANLRRARLQDSSLSRLQADGADFTDADVSRSRAEAADFTRARFERADLTRTVLERAKLESADLTGAKLVGACLRKARLEGAKIDGADFTDADLSGATLAHARLASATFTGACFRGARLVACDLEGVELPRADFSCAYLAGAAFTGSRMERADFHGAVLSEAKLGFVHWKGVNLRDADLRGATFHMGTTRSGLVGSTIASEGSRTGFYTDDYDDRHFKRPAEIRKANLCRADLRGANIEGVDFYLVDLRGAKYTDDQAVQFAQCGAILGDSGRRRGA